MRMDDYQDQAMRTAGEGVGRDLMLNGVMGLNGEAGEAIDIVKKHLFQGHHLDTLALAEELGDVMWYVAVTAKSIGFSLDEIAFHNIAKLKGRYPSGFDTDRSVNRETHKTEEL